MRLSDIFVSARAEGLIRQIYPKSEADRKVRRYGRRKAMLFAAVITGTVILSIPVFATDSIKLKKPVRQIERNESGKGSRTVTLNVMADNGYEDRITINVNERVYSLVELEDYSQKLDDILWTRILGDNRDGSYVTDDLDLVRRIEGYPFDITWKTDRPQIMSPGGVIDREKLAGEDPDNEGVRIMLCATCRYRDYTEEKEGYVIVHTASKNAEESIHDMIDTSVRESDLSSENDDKQVLPDHAGRTGIRFYDAASNRGWIVLFVGIAAAFLLMKVTDGKIKEKAGIRSKQIDNDYPNIVNQYALYHTAGMNPRAIWFGICSRYEEGLDPAGKNRRYAYEEMVTTRKMMEEGCGELAAYDEFAARCRSIKYRSFINLVKQSVIKGSRDLDEMLAEELDKAQRDKNNMIKTQASEAETRMLLPMFMILITVIAIVMIPAFIELNG